MRAAASGQDAGVSGECKRMRDKGRADGKGVKRVRAEEDGGESSVTPKDLDRGIT